jgi:hypothetical protein
MTIQQHTYPSETYVYRIDAHDAIIWVSDNWQMFVVANEGAENTYADQVLGRSLWDFITGMETRHLYQIVIQEARKRQKTVRLLFRCDAPDERRFLRLTINPQADGHLEFQSQILRTERRDSVDLLRRETLRGDTIVTLCSMCKKVKIAPDDWQEIERAINLLHLFETATPPQLSHGLCPACFRDMMAEIAS